MQDQYIDSATAATLARVSAHQINHLARNKTLDAYKEGRRWQISLASLNAYLERRADAGATWGWPAGAGKAYVGLSAQTLAGYTTRNATIKEAARLHVSAGRRAWVFLGFGKGGWTKWRAPNVT